MTPMKNHSRPIVFEYVTTDRQPKDTLHILFVDKDYDELLVDPDGARSLLMGIGKKKITRRAFITLTRKIIILAKSHRAKQLFISAADLMSLDLEFELSRAELFEILATNMEMANFEFLKYKTEPKDGWRLVKSIALSADKKAIEEIRQGVVKGQAVAELVNECRRLSNTPGGEMTPSVLADEAKEILKGSKVKLKVLGRREIEKLSMGGVLGVAKGSAEEPKFLVMEYLGGGVMPKAPKQSDQSPIVLVGKGVTFDTGGLNLKPTDGIYEMHMDMSGGAAVVAAMALASKLKLKKNIIGLVPAVENMPSGSSYRPGDVLTSMSGKTIEVLNTDAEGRIILADALTYAKRYNPRLVVDVATLTGASMIALGQRASALFTKDHKLEVLFRELGEVSGDYVWPLPLWDEYQREIVGSFGDYANLGKTRYGGAITGAMFLYQFAQEYPWVHIDMAPRMTAADGDYLSKGAAGEPVRLLAKLLERY